MPYSERMRFAIETALMAGRSTRAHFQSSVTVDRKRDMSPVTVADRHAETLIRDAIRERYPEDGIYGEEHGISGTADRRWVIDPIDGTKSFICGVPLYATLLSYEIEGEVKLGIAYFPALDELVCAELGGGTHWNGRPARVSSNTQLENATLCIGGHKTAAERGVSQAFEKLSYQVLATRTWSDAYGHALVATGRVDAMIDPRVEHYDISAMSIIVSEAGGTFTRLNGDPTLGTDAISSSGVFHDQLVAAFRGPA
ncbi:MAG: hypothetical protein JNM85_00325 [Chthonomonas sp.]|nr:hypothetical protein [Chthonomonas sp.]